MQTNHTIELATKSDQKDIQRFYKQQNYSARFLGFDSCYLIRSNNRIIATVIVSQLSECHKQSLIHALVVDKNQLHQGFATLLLTYAAKHHKNLICFADNSLSMLYNKAGFIEINYNVLSEQLNIRYQQYRLTKPNLLIFAKPKEHRDS